MNNHARTETVMWKSSLKTFFRVSIYNISKEILHFDSRGKDKFIINF